MSFPHPGTDDPLVVDLSGMNKGLAWLNGRCIGRYWLIAGTMDGFHNWQGQIIQLEDMGEPSQRYYHLPAEWLQENNELVLFEEVGGDGLKVEMSLVVPLDRGKKR